MKTQANYEIDWANINLDSPYERDQNILDPYDFDTLLLEIGCNIRDEDLTASNIEKHAQEVLRAKYQEALSIVGNNIQNIRDKAIEERKEN